MSTVDSVPPKVMLHVGLHKSGTTFLQSLWRANRSQLAEQGVHFPGGPGEPVQRMAVYDLLGRRPRGVDDQRVPGQWRALLDVVSSSGQPTVLISDEGLIFGSPRQAASAIESFPDREVHLVLTCRDLGRVLVSAWQEEIKNDRTWTWQEYIEAVRDPARRATNPARGFWRAQDLPAILATWDGVVPPERIHVVTVPPAGAPRGELLRRVGAVVGFDPAALTEEAPWDNSSLGVAGTEAIRRLNVNLGRSLNQRQHSHLVQKAIVPFLVTEGHDARYALPAEELAWVHALAQQHQDAVVAGGFPVSGDLDDLLPRPSSGARRPDEFTTDEVLDAALLALQAVSQRYVDRWWRRRRKDRAVVEPASRSVRLSSAARSTSYQSKRSAAALADRSALAAKALALYLKATSRKPSSDR